VCAFGNLIKAAADEKMMIARLGGRERRPLFSEQQFGPGIAENRAPLETFALAARSRAALCIFNAVS
jgi:hypothetical protein